MTAHREHPTAASLKLELVLRAPGPAQWLAAHLPALFGSEAETAVARSPAVSMGDLLADDASMLRSFHAGIVAQGTPPPAAATYLAAWLPGALARAVGYALATTGAGFTIDGEAAGDLRFHLHPDGWPLQLELPPWVVVTVEHPWAGDRHSEVVSTADALVNRTMRGLVATVSPLIDACHRTGRVGGAGLWNEVADALGTSLTHQRRVVPTPAMVAVLEAALRVPGAPWKARPRLGFAESRAGRVHVAQKGGCCLAYTADRTDLPTDDDGEPDPYRAAYLARFPPGKGCPRYCSTCSFRDPDDSAARQIFWHEHHG